MHAVLLAHGRPCPVSDLFGVSGRALLERLELPEPWAGTVAASLQLIDELDQEIASCEAELRQLGADHRYVPLLLVDGTWRCANRVVVAASALEIG